MSRFRALPYAKALFEVLHDAPVERLDRIVAELEQLAGLIAEVPELHRVMVIPSVSPDSKAAILAQVLDRLAVDDTTRRFVTVVQSHYRLEHMSSISEAFRELVDRSRGRSRATVETAGALDDRQGRALVEVLSALTGGDVVARFETRPELLAGFRARIGSRVFDGSLSGQVARLGRETLTEQG